MPIIPLPESATGTCLLSVAAESDGSHALAGVSVEVDRGTLIRCIPQLQKGIGTWALGSPSTWLDAVIEGKLEKLRLNGTSPQLAADLVHGLHVGLFGDRKSEPATGQVD
jgi:hypothetical protein